MKKKCSLLLYGLAVLFVGLFACGCSRHDFHVVVKDARGVTKGSPVIWQEQTVGEVASVNEDKAGVRLDVTLYKPYRKSIRVGAKACPVPDNAISGAASLLVIGGKEVSLPLLKKGVGLQEAKLADPQAARGFFDWLSQSDRGKTWLIVCVVAVLVFFVVLKLIAGVVKLALLAVAVAVVVFGARELKNDWSVEKLSSVSTTEVRQWISEHMEMFDKIRTALPKSDKNPTDSQK